MLSGAISREQTRRVVRRSRLFANGHNRRRIGTGSTSEGGRGRQTDRRRRGKRRHARDDESPIGFPVVTYIVLCGGHGRHGDARPFARAGDATAVDRAAAGRMGGRGGGSVRFGRTANGERTRAPRAPPIGYAGGAGREKGFYRTLPRRVALHRGRGGVATCGRYDVTL